MNDRIIVENTAIVTINDHDDVLFDSDIVIEGNRIVAVGDAAGYDRSTATIIDGSGKVALPGLVDLHYHTALGDRKSVV